MAWVANSSGSLIDFKSIRNLRSTIAEKQSQNLLISKKKSLHLESVYDNLFFDPKMKCSLKKRLSVEIRCDRPARCHVRCVENLWNREWAGISWIPIMMKLVLKKHFIIKDVPPDISLKINRICFNAWDYENGCCEISVVFDHATSKF